MKKVQVLLSTFNGEKYLKEQIDSLINQKDVIVQISVRDDGSTDSTLEILENYRKDGRLEYYAEENVGYKKSFLKLASYCVGKADYYAFCDQDDVWDQQKLSAAVKKLDEIIEDKPKLYFSNLLFVDEKLNKIGIKDYSNLNITLGCSMARFNISGCTMVFNNELLKLAVRNNIIEEIVSSHDAWFYKLCLSVGGEMVFDPNSYIKYRQHGNNVTGMKQGIKKRFAKQLKQFTTEKNSKSRSAELIYREYADIIPKKNLDLLSELNSYKDSPIKTIKLLFNKELKFGVPVIDALNKVEIIFRLY
jgi:glycosyltransferase involved in cell wall biosynthesis